MERVDLTSVTDELYALAPAEFTARRSALAAQARTEGDRALAAAITALRRPTAAAWLVNRLARHRPELLAELAELAERLRTAHRDLAGDQLRELSARRQSLVRSLADAAGELAGSAPSAAVLEQFTQTLEAAMADPDAEAAVRSGQLTTALFYSGFGGVDLTDAVATPARPRHLRSVPDTAGRTDRGAKSHRAVEAEKSATAAVRDTAPAEAPAESRQAAADRARQAARQRDLDRAEAAAARAGELAQAALRERDATERARVAAAAAVRALEHQLIDARSALKQAEAAAGSADRAQRRAVRDAERAAQRLATARGAAEESTT